MKLIKQEDIDKVRWDKLVLSDKGASIYCQSVFLDHLAENWMLLVNDDYSCGIPIPFTIRLGIKGIYTPNFIRTIDWVGLKDANRSEISTQAESILKKHFRLAQLKTLDNVFLHSKSGLVFQELKGKLSLNSQAKRSIKKFQKSDLTLENVQLAEVLPIITQELVDKVKNLNSTDIHRFESLLHAYPNAQLWVIGTKKDADILGGLVFMYWKNTLHYVKGGARREAKDLGAMYAMMDMAINEALSNNYQIDFGGSNVKGVRQFNTAFGGQDVPYYEWKWDQSPVWFKWLKALKNKRNSSN